MQLAPVVPRLHVFLPASVVQGRRAMQPAISLYVHRVELPIVVPDLDRAVTDAVAIGHDRLTPAILVEHLHLAMAFPISEADDSLDGTFSIELDVYPVMRASIPLHTAERRAVWRCAAAKLRASGALAGQGERRHLAPVSGLCPIEPARVAIVRLALAIDEVLDASSDVLRFLPVPTPQLVGPEARGNRVADD
jgi:hypothetical protein